MSDYVLACCAAADVTAEQYEEWGIKCMPYFYKIDDAETEDRPEEFDAESFYGKLDACEIAGTHERSVEEYIDFFRELTADGKDVVYVTLSSGLGNAYNVASGASVILSIINPDVKVYVVDSLCASSGMALLLDKAVELKNSGMPAAELAEWINENKLRVNHLFFTYDLSQFVKTGALADNVATFAKRWEICPIMNVDSWGELVRVGQVRKKEKVFQKAVKMMEKRADDKASYSGKIYMSDSLCREYALEVRKLIEERFPNAGEIRMNTIGATIGAHAGRGTVAVFFWGKESRS